MGRYDYDLGVIGGGSAGLTLTAGAAQLGAKVLLVEKEPLLGGDCLHYGCVPSKTLIRSANAYHMMKSGPEYGLPSASPGPVDFAKVAARIKQVIDKIQVHDSYERFCSLGAQVEFGSPVFVDPHTIELQGKTYTARFWQISTGSQPTAPPIEGLDQVPFLTNKEIFYLDELPESLLVLGGGPIAIEMSQAFARLGSAVTVVQRSEQILSKEDRDMADGVQQVLEAEGVKIITNTSLVSVSQQEGQKVVTYLGADKVSRQLQAAELLVSMGRTPNLAGLGLKEIGVEFNRKGLVLDSRLRTTVKHIYGAGDVTGAFQFTHAAGYEGGVVLANTIFRLPRKASYTYMPHATYCQPELASIGYNEKRAQKEKIDYTLWEENFENNDRSLAEGQRLGKLKLLLDKSQKPIGVQILGLHAGELLSEWVAVLGGKVKLSTLASAVHPYPTLGEINKKVAGSVLAPKLFSEKVKKGLKLIFHLKGRACSMDQAT